jgi:hypothetical protein
MNNIKNKILNGKRIVSGYYTINLGFTHHTNIKTARKIENTHANV